MEEEVKEAKSWRKKKVEMKAHDQTTKEETVRASAMPEEQKIALLKKMGLLTEKVEQGVRFEVYAKVRKVERERVKAMSVFPAAKKVRLATFKEWDEIFKNF